VIDLRAFFLQSRCQIT